MDRGNIEQRKGDAPNRRHHSPTLISTPSASPATAPRPIACSFLIQVRNAFSKVFMDYRLYENDKATGDGIYDGTSVYVEQLADCEFENDGQT